MPLIPFGDFRPDQLGTLYNNEAMPVGLNAQNTWPMSDGSDAPLRSRFATTNAMSEAPLGFHAYDADNRFAGSATKLYKQSGANWSDVSGAVYTGSIAVPWHFAEFGKRVIATNYTDAPAFWQVDASAGFVALPGSPPKARYVASVEPGFVMLGAINDGAAKLNSVRWSGLNDSESWPTIGTAAAAAAQSDVQALPLGGAITAILPGIGGASAVIFMERAIYRVRYIGPPAVFEFVPVVTHLGCAAPRSAIAIGGIAYFISHDGFCAFDGTSVKNLGEGRVNRFFKLRDGVLGSAFDDDRIFAAHDSYRKVIVWAYPENAGISVANAWLAYNYVSDRWRYAQNSTLNARWVGTNKYTGLENVEGFGTDNILYQWDDATGTALPIVATMETADFDGGSGSGRRVVVTRGRLIGDTPTADVTLRIGTRESLNSAIVYSAITTPGGDGTAAARAAGRYVRARIAVAADAEWTWAKGVEISAKALGRR